MATLQNMYAKFNNFIMRKQIKSEILHTSQTLRRRWKCHLQFRKLKQINVHINTYLCSLTLLHWPLWVLTFASSPAVVCGVPPGSSQNTTELAILAVKECVQVYNTLPWTDIPYGVYSHLAPNVSGMGSRSTVTPTWIKCFLKVNEWVTHQSAVFTDEAVRVLAFPVWFGSGHSFSHLQMIPCWFMGLKLL